ncbi:S-layer homology domain-containing protein [Paenibacillaceae bacterium GAS479]|nr:S-layer homology domain-containing protein [Paenibacillaceae bacterium GAS479]
MNRSKKRWSRTLSLGLSLTTAVMAALPVAAHAEGTAIGATGGTVAVSESAGTASLAGAATSVSEQVYSNTFGMTKIGEYRVGVSNEDGGVAEIVKYNRDNGLFYLVNGSANPPSLDIVALKQGQMELHARIDIKALAQQEDGFKFGDLTSVDVNTAVKRIFVAVQSEGTNDAGRILELDYGGVLVNVYVTGAQPDMVKSTPDGQYVLTADEGEPREGAGGIDPEGSVTLVDRNSGSAIQAKFDDPTIIADNVHIRGVADGNGQIVDTGGKDKARTDLEPEYIALSADAKTAFVTLQENNAVAVFDIEQGKFTSVQGLGLKDLSLPANALDLNAKDKKYQPVTADAYGVYMPDGIASFQAGDRTYLVTGNEGDATEWPHMTNVSKVKNLKGQLNPSSPAAALFGGTTAYDDVEAMSDWGNESIYMYGGRSFSIWDASTMKQVYDSGNAFEAITAFKLPDYFNASNSNNKFDSRSTKKGPEPEDIKIGQVGERTLAFTGLERIGGVMAYDVTSPDDARFVNYTNTRDFTAAGGVNAMETDSAPEGLDFISATDSPTGQPLLLVAYEVSGTVGLLQLDTTHVELDRKELLLTEGGPAVKLNAAVTPGSSTVVSVTYTSSQPDIASVDANGLVTPHKAGRTTIRAVSSDGYGVSEATVTVLEADKPSTPPTASPSVQPTATPAPTATPTPNEPYIPGPTATPSVTPTPTPTVLPMQVSVTNGLAVGVLKFAAQPESGIFSAQLGLNQAVQAVEALKAANASRRMLELQPTAPSDAAALKLQLSHEAAAKLADTDLEELRLSTGLASVQWSGEAFRAAVKAAAGQSIGLSIERAGGVSGTSFTVSLTAGDTVLKGNATGSIRLSVPYAAATNEAAHPEALVALNADGSPFIRSLYRDGGLILEGAGSGSYRIANVPIFYGDTAGKFMEAPVSFLAARSIIKGMSADAFLPQLQLTRADLAVLLSRIAGHNATSAGDQAAGFKDVPATAYYASAVAWAASEGITGGTGSDKFSPLAPITREQLAAMLVRFAGTAGWKLEQTQPIAAFADEAAISAYARDGVAALQQAGIIGGRPAADGSTVFAPQAAATRGEAAAMLAAFVQASIIR